MKSKLSKEKIIKISVIVSIILIASLLIFILYKNNIFQIVRNRIIDRKPEEIATKTECQIMKVNEQNMETVITIENSNGIERITAEDIIIEGKGKNKIALDRILENGKIYPISVKLVGKEIEEQYTIVAERQPNIVISNNDTLGDGSTKTVRIEYFNNLEDNKNYYSLDDGATWQEYTEELNILEVDNKIIVARSNLKEEKIKGKLIRADEPKENLPLIISTSLLEATDKAITKNDTYYRVAIKDQEYRVHTYVENGDTTFTSNRTYGNANDAGTASRNATTMEIVKVNGNLVVNSGVTVTSYGTAYGGTKGMLLYVTGNLENNGTITMTARGAKATGQNVYLWKNENNSYEYVPAIGAAGGASVEAWNVGKNGTSGTSRQTGGGGSGATQEVGTSGRGGNGTSYSGGAGGGAARTSRGQAGNDYGGAGGNAGVSPNWSSGTGGGAGNPGGSGCSAGFYAYSGQNGTGGLLTLYANIIENKGIISSNGMIGGTGEVAGGGSSGGGSVNIFFNTSITKGTISATGGTGGAGQNRGGAGGNGSISTGSIATGTYINN